MQMEKSFLVSTLSVKQPVLEAEEFMEKLRSKERF